LNDFIVFNSTDSGIDFDTKTHFFIIYALSNNELPPYYSSPFMPKDLPWSSLFSG
jgi:hypothetical protein